MTDEQKQRLYEAHIIRQTLHFGKAYAEQSPWPKTRAEWAQTGHGAPWDTNVHMARFALQLAQMIADARLNKAASKAREAALVEALGRLVETVEGRADILGGYDGRFNVRKALRQAREALAALTKEPDA